MTIRPQLYFDPADEDAAALADHVEQQARARGLTEVRRVPMMALVCERPLPNLPAPLGPSETGLDISHWNNNERVIDFGKVKAAGHRFVWLKRTQGTTFTDPLGAANFAAAAAAGGLWIGNYHFFDWRASGTAQSDYFSLACGEALGNFPEMVDVELEDADSADPSRVDKARAEGNLRALLAGCEGRFLRKPVIYTSRRYWADMFDSVRVADLVRGYKFLVADWTPPLDALPAGLAWAHFWQKRKDYTIPGLAGVFDLDEYRGDAPPPTARHEMRDKNNQAVLNLFWKAFGSWSQLSRAIPDWAATLGGARLAPYTGPAIEDFDLTPAEKAALIAAL
jgi:lysozyme